MKSKYYTIMVIPERTKTVRQLKIPKILVKLAVFCLVAVIGYTVVITRSYISTKEKFDTELAGFNDIQAENVIKNEQLKLMAERLEALTTQVGSIEKLNSQIRMMANLEQPETSGKSYGIGGPSPAMYDSLAALDDSEERSIKQFYTNVDRLYSKASNEQESLLDLINFLDNQQSFLASTPSVWPTRGRKTSNFGYRISPFTGKKVFHNAIDISAREGTPIIAPADGTVKVARLENSYGNLIIIDHGYGIVTKYAHMLTYFVEPGQKVRRGDKIGLVGNTGRSTGAHLHYEIRVSKVPVNPLQYILN